MTKAELEFESQAYFRAVEAAQLRERNHQYKAAIASAVTAWPHVVGMMQFSAKFEERTIESVDAFDIALRYCPCLLDCRTLEALASYLAGEKRRFKGTKYGTAELFESAKQFLWDCHSLWEFLADSGEIKRSDLAQRFGTGQTRLTRAIKVWQEMGLIRMSPTVLTLATRLGMLTSAKCWHCGVVASAPKSMFLEKQPCESCGKSDFFVLVANSLS